MLQKGQHHLYGFQTVPSLAPCLADLDGSASHFVDYLEHVLIGPVITYRQTEIISGREEVLKYGKPLVDLGRFNLHDLVAIYHVGIGTDQVVAQYTDELP